MDQRSTASAADLMRRADAARDGRRWEEAARAYAAYLKRDPWDRAARVQYGHCLKEAGDLAGALAAYREAEAQGPEDADLALQIGHALKLIGDPEAAWRAYARALALDPTNEAAAREVSELAHLAAPMQKGLAARAPGQIVQLVFDASDLIEFLRGARAPTGIQRVQFNIIVQALLDPPDDRAIAIVAFEEHVGFWREIPRDLFLRLWRLSRTGANIADPAWVEVIDDCVRAMHDGRDFPFAEGAVLVNLGTSWWIKDYFLRVRHVQQRLGVRYIPFLHDCIPLLVPEHCERKLVHEFAQWFAELTAHADAALANSANTAKDVTRFAEELLPGLQLPVRVMRLDASLREDLGAGAPLPVRPVLAPHPDLPAEGEEFILCVGTIESRKNHLMLFQAWLTMLRRHGPDRVPPLVCVGKPGWLADAAMTLLRTAPELRGKVRLLHGIPDFDLARLYERCLFTVYNSFYEGWGLPVTEALSYGKIPVLPRHSGLIEAGAQGGVFFEPGSEPDLVSKLESLIFDVTDRMRREAALRANPGLRSWKAIAAQLMSDPVLTGGGASIPPGARFHAGEGEILRPALAAEAMRPARQMALADLLRDGLFWHPLEEKGAWTRPGPARLRIPLAPGAEGRFRVHLGLLGPPSGTTIGLRALSGLEARGAFQRVTVPPRQRVTVVIEAEARDGAIVIEIEAPARTRLVKRKKVEAQQVGVCVTHVMACRPDDMAARTAFLEHQHFLIVEPG